jgi:hypothetical protein
MKPIRWEIAGMMKTPAGQWSMMAPLLATATAPTPAQMRL